MAGAGAGAAAAVNAYAPIPAFSIVLFPPAATLDHNQTRHILRSSISTYIILCNVTRQKFKRNRQKRLTPTLVQCYAFIDRFNQYIITSVWYS